MAKRLILALLMLGATTFLGGEAYAGCIFSPPFCASYITGSGMTTALVDAPTPLSVPQNTACPTVVAFQGPTPPCTECSESCPEFCEIGLTATQLLPDPPEPPFTSRDPITSRIVGTRRTTVSPTCGFDTGEEFCDIEGVAICTTEVDRKATTRGPLAIASPDGFGQTDGSTSAANYRFQLDLLEQERLCGLSDDPVPVPLFKAFIVREGLFETCVRGVCIQEFCKVDLGGINRDEPRPYNCRPI